jgi:23S rRNA pseudouridine1911/1915/1917 synthase
MSVEVSLPPPLPLIIAPDETVRFGVLLEDEHILVIDKPAGLVVHPGAGQAAGTLVNGLLYYLGSELRQVGDALRPGIVHRLDKDTSGVMVVAKTDAAYQGLVRQFLPPRSISRRYLALVSALPKTSLVYGKNEGEELCGSIESAIGRDRKDRKKMTVLSSGGKQASTEWRIREALAHGFLLEVLIHTGRTHQIRVHLEQAAAPIVGDPIYGRGKKALPLHLAEEVQKFGRQALHAEKLSFLHPVCGGELSVESPLPEDMSRLVSLFNT